VNVGVVVPVGDPVTDVFFQRVDRCVHAAAQLFVGQQREPPLDLVEQGRVGELRIIGQFERVDLMRPEPERFPDPASGRFRQSGLGGHRGPRPMCGIFGARSKVVTWSPPPPRPARR